MGFQGRQSKSQDFNLLIQEPAILEQNQFFLQGRKKLKKKVLRLRKPVNKRTLGETFYKLYSLKVPIETAIVPFTCLTGSVQCSWYVC